MSLSAQILDDVTELIGEGGAGGVVFDSDPCWLWVELAEDAGDARKLQKQNITQNQFYTTQNMPAVEVQLADYMMTLEYIPDISTAAAMFLPDWRSLSPHSPIAHLSHLISHVMSPCSGGHWTRGQS